MATVNVLYFARLRETLGCAQERCVLPAEVRSVAALRAHLMGRGEKWQALAAGRNARAAVNQRMAGESDAVADGDEVAFFPPVTGG